MARLCRLIGCLVLAVTLVSLAAPVIAQTPFDAHTSSLGTFIRLNLGPLLVMVLLIMGFLTLGYALHSGPVALMGLVVLIVMATGIASAINGTALTWLGLTPIP